MKYIWEDKDIKPGVKAHCASGTYVVVRSTQDSIVLTLVNLEFYYVLKDRMRPSEIADHFNELEAWPDGYPREIEVSHG